MHAIATKIHTRIVKTKRWLSLAHDLVAGSSQGTLAENIPIRAGFCWASVLRRVNNVVRQRNGQSGATSNKAACNEAVGLKGYTSHVVTHLMLAVAC